MSFKFIISHLDEQLGPFDENELKAKWVKGELLPIDYVYDDDKQDWMLLSERFPWATKQAEATAPPPLKDSAKKIRAPEPVEAAEAVTAELLASPPEPFVINASPNMTNWNKSAMSASAAPPLPPPPASQQPAPQAPQQVTQQVAQQVIQHVIQQITPPAPMQTVVQTATPQATRASSPPPSAMKSVGQDATVQLVDGMGEVDLAPLPPGEVELFLQNASTGPLKLQNTFKIKAKPAEPHSLEWSVPAEQIVGQPMEIQVRALDRAGQVCLHYVDQFLIRVNGASGKEIHVPLKDGVSRLVVHHTLAEKWRLSFHYSGARVLKLPGDLQVEWQPGPATKIILDGPQDYIAGRPLKVSVKAVDDWGNLVKNYQGTVVLEVKAS